MTAADFRTHPLNSWLVVHAEGRLDRSAAVLLQRRLNETFRVHPLIVLDLTGADPVIPECTPALVVLHHQAELHGGAFVLISADRKVQAALRNADPRGRLVVCARLTDLPFLSAGDDCSNS